MAPASGGGDVEAAAQAAPDRSLPGAAAAASSPSLSPVRGGGGASAARRRDLFASEASGGGGSGPLHDVDLGSPLASAARAAGAAGRQPPPVVGAAAGLRGGVAAAGAAAAGTRALGAAGSPPRLTVQTSPFARARRSSAAAGDPAAGGGALTPTPTAGAAAIGSLWEGPVALTGRAAADLRARGYAAAGAGGAPLTPSSAAGDFASFAGGLGAYATLRCRAALECAASLAESPRLPPPDAPAWTPRRAAGAALLALLSLFALRHATPDNIHAVVVLMRGHPAAAYVIYSAIFVAAVVLMLPGMLFSVAAGAAFGFGPGAAVSFFATVTGESESGLCGLGPCRSFMHCPAAAATGLCSSSLSPLTPHSPLAKQNATLN